MATIRRARVIWNGVSGLPGLSVFFAPAGVDPTGSLVAFFNAIKGEFPAPLTWTVENGGDELDDGTGVLSGGWAGTAGGPVVATGAAAHAAGTGAYVNWNTNTVVNGRRVKGRTFLAPLRNEDYDSAGTITSAALAILQVAANNLVTTADTIVWHRPGSVGGGAGSSAVIQSASVPDQVTSLRTRRR
jgi:hypothetical protein